MIRTVLFFIPLLLGSGIFHSGCTLIATRPVQDMSDTAAAIRAAKEAQADTLAPELFRLANEAFALAQREYRFKNFKMAQDSAVKARRFAEQAELESIQNKGHANPSPPPPAAPPANDADLDSEPNPKE